MPIEWVHFISKSEANGRVYVLTNSKQMEYCRHYEHRIESTQNRLQEKHHPSMSCPLILKPVVFWGEVAEDGTPGKQLIPLFVPVILSNKAWTAKQNKIG